MGIIFDTIEGMITEEMQKLQPRIIRASGLAMRDVRDEIIRNWFGGFSSDSMIGAFVYPKAKGSLDSNGGTITVNTYAKVEMYNPSQEIQNWNNRNKLGIAPYDLMKYVMELQLYEGIIGLPASGTLSTDWVNENFHQQSPLLDSLMKSSNWSGFKEKLLEYL